MEIPFVLVFWTILNLTLSIFIGFSMFAIMSHFCDWVKFQRKMLVSIWVIIIFQELWWSNCFNIII